MPDINRYELNKTLKRCPFCGGQPYIEFCSRSFMQGRQTRASYIRCKDCQARGGKFEQEKGNSKDSLYKAIANWNNRV